ncbi:MAG TPA: amidohydrolase family protein [Amycolatopsis sp.]|nr:amidohydrolase family protein [Amycolatopsis sp.]
MVIDGYLHIGLPRFQSASDALVVMDSAGIGKAVACPFTTCPDLVEVHRALRLAPERIRAAGLPLGADRGEVEKGIRAQLEAGFDGLRLSGQDVAERSWTLDALGDAVALVCGEQGLHTGAEALLSYLGRNPGALVLGGHFAGPVDPEELFRRYPATAELFAHERFAVICSRQGLFDPPLMQDWTAALIERVGWRRLLWGSEAPVLHWRDEPIATAMRWIERFEPDAEQAADFYSGNAQRLVFDRPRREITELRLPFDPFAFEVAKPSPTWPYGLPLDNRLTGRLLHGWLGWGGAGRGPLRQYLDEVLAGALPEVNR